MLSDDLRRQFGDIDIYLFDQLLRGRFDGRERVLDAGCGHGRNLPFLLSRGIEVFAADTDDGAVRAARELFSRLAPRLTADHVQHAAVDALPWPDRSMDAVISSAVLHFARDEAHFRRMVVEMWRVLAPGGLFFARLASSIGIESLLPSATGRVRLPDGSERFVVDEPMLLSLTAALGAQLLDPLKTTNVQNMRAMTTWVARKNPTDGLRSAAAALHSKRDGQPPGGMP